MTSYLIDTNVVSAFTRDAPDPRIVTFFTEADLAEIFIPDVVLAEVAFGIERISDDARRSYFSRVLDSAVRPLFENRVLSATEDVWLVWKRIEWQGRKRGYTFSQPDLVIAAMAVRHGLTVVTRDTRPFKEAGALFLDPWS
jgi:toxin FitB